MPNTQRWREALNARAEKGLYRQQKMNPVGDPELINFSSNDYLGLSQAIEVKQAFSEGISQYGTGSGASPLVTGYYDAHESLCQQLCHWLGKPKAMLFSSGFSANQALLFTLLQRGDVVLQDKLNHASLMEAGMLSPATQWRFLHNDLNDLETKLQRYSPLLTVTEGVFSMDGDCAPVNDIAVLSHDHQSLFMVDDAHSIGVLGDHGEGSAAFANADITLVTFGKALGVHGAAIVCDDLVYEYMLQFARHYTYSTAMPPAQAVAVSKAIECAQTQQWRREKLSMLSELFYEQLSSQIVAPRTSTPIKPILLNDAGKSVSISETLLRRGCRVGAIRPPTVPTSRLRITLTAEHTVDQVTYLCRTLNDILLS